MVQYGTIWYHTIPYHHMRTIANVKGCPCRSRDSKRNKTPVEELPAWPLSLFFWHNAKSVAVHWQTTKQATQDSLSHCYRSIVKRAVSQGLSKALIESPEAPEQ